ncbi:MAG: shikimate dehydrogenase [Devosia sp.]
MKHAFVVGHPIAHSRSPLIHNYWLKANAIAGTYEPIDVLPDDLPAFFDRIREGRYVGGNVTLPHKAAAYLLSDERESLADSIGAVNTLVRLGSGAVEGRNTDYLGFLGNLDQNAPGWSEALNEVVVLGAGGACRAVVVALKSRGVRCIHLLNRTIGTAEDMAIELEGPIAAGSLAEFPKRARRAGLLINTTSVGMKSTRFDGLDLGALPQDALVTDLVYTPLVTPLLAEARALGLRTVDGLGMLLHQAVPGFEAWFGVKPEVTAELRALVEASL